MHRKFGRERKGIRDGEGKCIEWRELEGIGGMDSEMEGGGGGVHNKKGS
jgi:hypothetical protein